MRISFRRSQPVRVNRPVRTEEVVICTTTYGKRSLNMAAHKINR